MLNLIVRQKYFNAIRSGHKTVEGRLNSPKFKDLKAADLIKVSSSGSQDQLTCAVVSVQAYKTFEEMLVAEGMENVFPGIDSLREAVEAYESFPGYKKDVKKMGALAIKIKVVFR